MIIQTGKGEDGTDSVGACGVQVQVQQLQIPILQMLLTAAPNHGQCVKSIRMNDGDEFVTSSIGRQWSRNEACNMALSGTFILILPVIIISIKVFF